MSEYHGFDEKGHRHLLISGLIETIINLNQESNVCLEELFLYCEHKHC